jgi:hypothetical protein
MTQLPDRRIEGHRDRSLRIVRQQGTELDPWVTRPEGARPCARRELPGIPLAQREEPAKPDKPLRDCFGTESGICPRRDLGQQRARHDRRLPEFELLYDRGEA